MSMNEGFPDGDREGTNRVRGAETSGLRSTTTGGTTIDAATKGHHNADKETGKMGERKPTLLYVLVALQPVVRFLHVPLHQGVKHPLVLVLEGAVLRVDVEQQLLFAEKKAVGR